jgi:nucleoside-diphosphate-sugar epimerase
LAFYLKLLITISTMTDQQKVVIFGSSGAIGTHLAEYLSKEYPHWEIHAVTRNADSLSRLKTMSLPNVQIVTGDPFDKQSVLDLTKDCDIIVSCIGFHLYEAKYWAKHWPLTVDNLLAAAAAAAGTKKKRLVFCDNLYAYGNPDTKISAQTKPVEASLKSKPGIRATIRQTFSKHMEEHPGTLSVVGGADFFGPYVTVNSFLGDTMTGKIVATAQGSTPTALAIGSADKIHDFCYTVDFAKALGIACVNDKALDKFWICPHAIHDKTLRQIAADIAKQAGKPTPKMQVLSGWMLTLLSPFVGFLGEMKEMLIFWNEDYVIDDSEFMQVFNVKPTPYEQALDAYIQFYKENAAS